MKTQIIKSVLFSLVLGFALVLTTMVNANAQKSSEKAVRIAVVFNDAVRLTNSMRKASYSDDHSKEEAFIKHYLEELLKKEGHAVAQEPGENVVDVTFYIGIDDADDDNDGTADTTDTDHYGTATPESVKDSEIKSFDFDEIDPAEAKKLVNDKSNQGIYLLIEVGDEAMTITMDEDVLGTGDIEGMEEAAELQISSPPAFTFAPVNFTTAAPSGRRSSLFIPFDSPLMSEPWRKPSSAEFWKMVQQGK